MRVPLKIEVFKATGGWLWKAIFANHVEHSPEYYLSRKTAKAIARICFPQAMIIVFK